MKKRLQGILPPFVCLLVLVFGFCSFGWAQNARELIREADLQMRQGKADLAVANYLQAESQTSGNSLLTFKLGMAYLESSWKYKALPYMLLAYKEIPTSDPDMELHLARAYQYTYNFDEAIRYYQVYMQHKPEKEEEIKERIKACKVAEDLYNNPREVSILNLGPSVNSPENDFSPLITPDQKMMVFTSRRKGTNSTKKTADGEYFEDVFITYRLSDTLWTKPTSISKNVNSPFHDAAAALSPDGKKLFIYLDEGGGDLFMSEFDGVDWSKPKTLGKNINSRYWETSVTITADGQKIYFSSNRPGGYGGLDIYVSKLQADGQWGPAENLGPTINTPKNEDSPFVHPDGQTLYFSSNGHPGLGGFDIFRSEFKGGQWGAVKNFGYPVNTVDDDAHFVMSENRKKAYFTSVKENGVGKADIYSITFPYNTSLPAPPKEQPPLLTSTQPLKHPEVAQEEKALPEKQEEKNTTMLKGNVSDHSKDTPLRATVSLTNNATAELVAKDETDPETGDFELMVSGLGNFGLNIESKGFLFFSKNITLTEADQQREKKEIKVEARMRPLQLGSTVVLANIFFNSAEYTLRKESYAELEKVVAYLRKSPKLKIQINGHTDNVGEAAYNKVLSEKRAGAVRDYLLKAGIAKEHVSIKGYGEERPLVSNDDELEGRELNRRTEIEVRAF